MARSTTSMKKKSYTRYSDAYRQEALALADRIGVAAAARELGIHASQLYQWRSKAQLQQDTSERERSLAEENARLKRRSTVRRWLPAYSVRACALKQLVSSRPPRTHGIRCQSHRIY